MSNKDNSSPAFPVPGLNDDEYFNGMSLRDYFAAKALSALIEKYEGQDGSMEGIPQDAYLYADAMLAERAK